MSPELNALLARPERAAAGIRLGVKDLFDTAGLTTTYGSAIFAEHVPARSAEAVVRLERAGYAVVAKTNLHEFAYGITSENEYFGDVGNPLDASRYPGGSSGGSAAALAAGLCDVALGTDSAGSIRIPAACCGIVGFKPTHGLVPLEGCFPLAPSFDVGGPMARSAADCERALAALVPGWDPAPLAALADVSVGVAWVADADAGVAARVSAAAERFPTRREVEFPRQPDGIGAVFMQEAAEVHRDLFAEHAEAYSANVRAKVERCLAVAPDAVAGGLAAREAYREEAERALAGCDLLLVPTIGTIAPRRTLREPDLRPSVLSFTYPFNSLAWPALALPCGPAEDGLPASVTLAGPAGSDALVLAAGILLEEALSR